MRKECTTPVTEHGRHLLERAKRLSKAGWRTFPWGKRAGETHDHPLWRSYFGDHPYSDWRLTTADWDTAIGIGIACPSWIIGLDIDKKKGKHGFEHLSLLEAQHGSLPNAPRTVTKSGGEHRLFRRTNLHADTRFRSHVALPNGGSADIDLIHGKYRYFKVYDDDFWLTQARLWVPELPEAWHPVVVKSQSHPLGLTNKTSTGHLGQTDTDVRSILGITNERVMQLVAEVANAVENRNNTLNRNYYMAARAGHTSQATRELFKEAALSAGLELSEVLATLDSASKATREVRIDVNAWLDSVSRSSSALGRTSRTNILRLALEIAEISLRKRNSATVGLSCRQAAELLNISAKSAARYLNHLKEQGLLEDAGKSEMAANQYRLISRPIPQTDTVPHSLGARQTRAIEAADASISRTIELHQLLAHDAFARVGDGPVLPPSCAEVLCQLKVAPSTVKELCLQLGRHRSTVDRALLVLQSAGIVDIGGKALPVRLTQQDLTAALDAWVLHLGVDGRTGLRKQRHRVEQEDFHAGPRQGTKESLRASNAENKTRKLVSMQRPQKRRRILGNGQETEG